jgi:hypothetical protein
MNEYNTPSLMMAMASFVFGMTRSIWVEKRAGTLYFSKGVLTSVSEDPVTLSILDGSTMDFSPEDTSNEMAKFFRTFGLGFC